jgi:hypothetical protein
MLDGGGEGSGVPGLLGIGGTEDNVWDGHGEIAHGFSGVLAELV